MIRDLALRAVSLAPVARIVWAVLMVGYSGILAALLIAAYRDRRR